MSLKAFHIVFIVASVGLSAFVAVWGIQDYSRTSDTSHLTIGVASIVLGVVLLWYSTWFVRKLKSLPGS